MVYSYKRTRQTIWYNIHLYKITEVGRYTHPLSQLSVHAWRSSHGIQVRKRKTNIYIRFHKHVYQNYIFYYLLHGDYVQYCPATIPLQVNCAKDCSEVIFLSDQQSQSRLSDGPLKTHVIVTLAQEFRLYMDFDILTGALSMNPSEYQRPYTAWILGLMSHYTAW